MEGEGRHWYGGTRLLGGCSQLGARPQTGPTVLAHRALVFMAGATVTLVMGVATGAFRNRNNDSTLAEAGNPHTRGRRRIKRTFPPATSLVKSLH